MSAYPPRNAPTGFRTCTVGCTTSWNRALDVWRGRERMRGEELVARDGLRRRVGRRSRDAMVADADGDISAWVL